MFPPLGATKVSGRIDPQNWDRLVLGGNVCPGLATITAGGIKLREDKKPKAGADGSSPCYHGIDPQALGVDIETNDDWEREDLAALLTKYTPVQDRPPEPVSIDHPSIRHLNIAMVVLTSIGPFLYVKPGVTKVHIGFSHWMPPKSNKSASVTPKKTAGIRNMLREKADQIASKNVKPTERKDFAAPPAGVK
jgi:hypothetical protein